MHASAQSREQENRIPAVIETDEDLRKFRPHLKEIVEGAAFRGSQRSAQFLTYVVEQAIGGQWNALKERTIGIELFGRSPTYDTGEDAIVRVTASDVRRRLLQHYGRYGAASEFRVSLPAGHYIPEIVREPRSVPRIRRYKRSRHFPIHLMERLMQRLRSRRSLSLRTRDIPSHAGGGFFASRFCFAPPI
jgi:hypothetical protein